MMRLGAVITAFALVSAVFMTAGAGGAFAQARDLAALIGAAEPGEIVRLPEGTYRGGVVIDKPLTLTSEGQAVIDGAGLGHVLTLAAPDITVSNLTIRNSGDSLNDENSGVFVTDAADRARVEGNRFEHNLIGVYLKGPDDAVVTGNHIAGRTDLRVNERGNGVHLWNTPGSRIVGNTITGGRDGIFTTTSKDNLFADNTMEGVRFAVHYMYTNRSVLRGNRSLGNDAGYVIMFSHHLTVENNLSRGDRDHGLLFNYANASTMRGNAVVEGGEKCVFIYNANKNVFRGNRFEGCAIGIHFTAGSERNTIVGNAFVNNESQVKYVGTRHLEWAENGVGNYWSDNAAFDLNADGIADRPYRPNGLVDQIVWRAPEAKLLLTSPAVQIIGWAQSAFPAILPGGVVDPYPLMQPPAEAAAPQTAEVSKP
jgi:nitrous oxidase accessory protein